MSKYKTRINLIGKRFGKLIVVGKSGVNKHGNTLWICRCDCGNDSIVSNNNLQSGNTKSCGCLRRANLNNAFKAIPIEIGTRYGKLIVVKYAGRGKSGEILWYCRCDCGKQKITSSSSLKQGQVKSCGCLRKFHRGQSAFNAILHDMKKEAKRRNHKWGLSIIQFKELINSPCAYCGMPPSNIKRSPCLNGSYTYSGIDRIDNDKGYTTDNVAPCCIICNKGKMTKSLSEFIEWIKTIVLFNGWDKGDWDFIKFKNIKKCSN